MPDLKEGGGMRRILVLCLFASLAVWALPSAANAGAYIDWECGTPAGGPTKAEGFTPTASPSASAINSCGTTGGTLDIGLHSRRGVQQLRC